MMIINLIEETLNSNLVDTYLSNINNDIIRTICICFLSINDFIILVEKDQEFKSNLIDNLLVNKVIPKEIKYQILKENINNIEDFKIAIKYGDLFKYFIDFLDSRCLKNLLLNPKIIQYVIEHPDGFKGIPWDIEYLYENENYYKFFDFSLNFIENDYKFNFRDNIISYYEWKNSKDEYMKKKFKKFFTFNIKFVIFKPIIIDIYRNFLDDKRALKYIEKSPFMFDIINEGKLDLDINKNYLVNFNEINTYLFVCYFVYKKKNETYFCKKVLL